MITVPGNRIGGTEETIIMESRGAFEEDVGPTMTAFVESSNLRLLPIRVTVILAKSLFEIRHPGTVANGPFIVC